MLYEQREGRESAISDCHVRERSVLRVYFHRNLPVSGHIAYFSTEMSVNKRSYRRYSEEDLKEALNAVRSGTMSQRQAAKHFNVGQATISDHIRGRVSEGSKPGRKPVLPIEVENKIVEKTLSAAQCGFGFSRQLLAAKVCNVTKKLKIKTPFRNGIPGYDWWKGFKDRHPEVSLRTPEAQTDSRSKLLNPQIVNSYFQDLGNIIAENDLSNRPKCIWNMDETSCCMEHKPVPVVARKGSRSIPGRASHSRETFSVLVCVNADGSHIPPMIIARGKTERCLHGLGTALGPANARYTYQERAWMNDELGVKWFGELFLPNCGPERPQLIILDSHHSHEVLDLLVMAKQNGIIIMAMPPHTTHMLCPLDRTVFKPLKDYYNRECSDFLSLNPTNQVTKWNWPKLFKTAFDNAVTPTNIKEGFRACGIHPHSAQSISAAAFAPSTKFDKPEINEDDISRSIPSVDNPNTLESMSSSLPSQVPHSCVDVPSTSSISFSPPNKVPKTSLITICDPDTNEEQLVEVEVIEMENMDYTNVNVLSGDQAMSLPLSNQTPLDHHSNTDVISVISVDCKAVSSLPY